MLFGRNGRTKVSITEYFSNSAGLMIKNGTKLALTRALMFGVGKYFTSSRFVVRKTLDF